MTVKIEIAPDALIIRIWAESGEVRARLTTGDVTVPTVGRDDTLAAVAAWLDEAIAALT